MNNKFYNYEYYKTNKNKINLNINHKSQERAVNFPLTLNKRLENNIQISEFFYDTAENINLNNINYTVSNKNQNYHNYNRNNINNVINKNISSKENNQKEKLKKGKLFLIFLEDFEHNQLNLNNINTLNINIINNKNHNFNLTDNIDLEITSSEKEKFLQGKVENNDNLERVNIKNKNPNNLNYISKCIHKNIN